ncbi:MAG: hypothetical protein P8X62_08500 [Flavobacteriaceae bacterium]|jgi:hypothetical protein
MGKSIAVIYSFLILIQSFNINFEDVSKLQAFVEHAKYHQETYGDSFLEFLSEHYGDKTIEHQDKHKEHEDLPFKDSYHIYSHINTSFLYQPINFEIKQIGFTEIPFNFFYKDSFTTFEKPSVFQPPKVA